MSEPYKEPEKRDPSQPPASPRTGRRAGFFVRLYRLVRGTLALFGLILTLLILTPIADHLYIWLDVTKPARRADVIVCLGGDPARLIWTVDAYRKGCGDRVIVTNWPGAAEWMQAKLLQCGLPRKAILVDNHSRNTAEHPHAIAALPGIDPANQRFLIVTDPDHSRRAAACFRKAGFAHISVYASGFPLRTDGPYWRRCRWRVLSLPRIVYEYAGLIQYWCQGRI